jgi:hypothetical protein
LVRIDLAGHNHHPDQKDGSNDPECEFSLPALTYHKTVSKTYLTTLNTSQLTDIPLLQVCKCIPSWPLGAVAEHICIALIVDIRSRKQLYRRADYACDEEHEEDKGEQHHSAGKESALRDEDDFDDDEDEGKGADGDAVGHDPVKALVYAQRA